MKCNTCGEVFNYVKGTTRCPTCGGDIDLTQIPNLTSLQNELDETVEKYQRGGSREEILDIINKQSDYIDYPNFDIIWNKFIKDTVKAAIHREDTKLQNEIKKHAEKIEGQNGKLFGDILKDHPELGVIDDWRKLISKSGNDELELNELVRAMIECIHKNNSIRHASDMFDIFSSGDEDFSEAGKKFVKALLTNKDISNSMFTIAEFEKNDTKTNEFAKKLRKYCEDNGLDFEFNNSALWKSCNEAYTRRKKKEKRKTMIISTVIVAVIVIVAVCIAMNLSSSGTSGSIRLSLGKAIDTAFGEGVLSTSLKGASFNQILI